MVQLLQVLKDVFPGAVFDHHLAHLPVLKLLPPLLDKGDVFIHPELLAVELVIDELPLLLAAVFHKGHHHLFLHLMVQPVEALLELPPGFHHLAGTALHIVVQYLLNGIIEPTSAVLYLGPVLPAVQYPPL